MNAVQGAPVTARVLVGVDGSEPSMQALRWAHFLASATDTAVEAVMCWQPFTDWGAMGMGWAAMPADWNPEQDASKALTATIDEVFGEHRPSGLLTTVRGAIPRRSCWS